MSRYTLLSMAALAAAQVQQGAPSLSGSTGSGVGSSPLISNPGAAGSAGLGGAGGGLTGAGLGGAAGGGAAGAGLAGAAGGLPPAVANVKIQTAVPMLLLGTDPEPILGSIIEAPNAQATTIQIGCIPGLPADQCGLPPSGYAVIHESQSIFKASVTIPGTYTMSWQCTVTSAAGVSLPGKVPPLPANWGNTAANAAVCATAVTIPGQNNPPAGTTTFTGVDFLGQILPVAITSGVEKLQAAATAAPGASATPSSSSGGNAAAGGAAGGAVGGSLPAGTTAPLTIVSSTASVNNGMGGGNMALNTTHTNTTGAANSTTGAASSNVVLGGSTMILLLASSLFVGASGFFVAAL